MAAVLKNGSNNFSARRPDCAALRAADPRLPRISRRLTKGAGRRLPHIVVMDNLSTHTGAKVRQVIEARGCQLLFLPSSSPDLSPIEEAKSCAESVFTPG
jgi:hypothetical protein